MDTTERAPIVATEPRQRPAWLDFTLSLAWLLFVVPAAILQGLLFGEEDPEKYRPFARRK